MKQTKVFVVTSHGILNEGICHLLEDALTQRSVCGVGTFSDLLISTEIRKPDVIVLAEPVFGLPISYVVRKIREMNKNSRIVVLQYRLGIFSPYRLFRCGVYAVLHEDCTVTDLRQAVRNAENRRPFVTEYAAESLAMDRSRSDAPHLEFSDREAETFFMIVNGYTTREIAEALGVNSNVISMRKSSIGRRINVESISEMVQYALAHDIVRKIN